MSDSDVMGSMFAFFMMVCIALPMTILVIWSIIWAYNDANKRGKSGCLVALLVFFVTWPAGLIIWLVFRPEEKEPPR
jgi:hypothetical protein